MSTKKASRRNPATVLLPPGPRWLLPTNHYNLMYWLAAGLVLPESAMSKYYADCLRTARGWLPLFRDTVAKAALDAATAERGTAALLDFDLTQLSGSVKGVTAAGEICDCHFPDGLPESLSLILVPAPLPAHWVRRVTFLSSEARENYRLRREDFANVTSFEIPLEVGKYPVSADFMNQPWLPPGCVESPSPWPTRTILHEGAIRALLHALGNRGNMALEVAKAAVGVNGPSLLDSAIFRDGINELLSQGVKREAAEMRVRLYWGVVDHIRTSVTFESDSEPAAKVGPEQLVLDYLNAHGRSDPVTGTKLLDLADDLRQILGFGGSTIRELFERHPGPFAHALLLFCLRRHADELFDFDTPGVTVAEADWLAAAILFGLREDWMAMPQPLRTVPGLYQAIAYCMAANAHRVSASGIELGPVPSCPTLRELFSVGVGRWPVRQQEAAIKLIRAQGWQDALETRVQLGKGDYRLEITAAGVQIVLPGEVKAVSTDVRSNRLLEHLSALRWPIDPKTELEVRDILGNL